MRKIEGVISLNSFSPVSTRLARLAGEVGWRSGKSGLLIITIFTNLFFQLISCKKSAIIELYELHESKPAAGRSKFDKSDDENFL